MNRIQEFTKGPVGAACPASTAVGTEPRDQKRALDFSHGPYQSSDVSWAPDRPHVSCARAIQCCRNFGTVSIVGRLRRHAWTRFPMGSAIKTGAFTFRIGGRPTGSAITCRS